VHLLGPGDPVTGGTVQRESDLLWLNFGAVAWYVRFRSILRGQSVCLIAKRICKFKGYSPDEIRSYIESSSLAEYIEDALIEPEDALLRCTDTVGGLDLIAFCYSGCTQPLSGDTCGADI
jgi:hypothetical protein